MGIAVRELVEFDPEAWNHRVESVPEGTINQTTHVEGFYLVTSGAFRPRYLVAEDDQGRVVGQLVALEGFYAAQEVVSRPWLRGLSFLGRAVLRTYTWRHGPLVFAREVFEEVFSALVGCVDGWAAQDGFMIRQASLPFYGEAELAGRGGEVLGRLGFTSHPEATFHVDLCQSQERLWQGLKSSARKNLKKLLEAGDLKAGLIDSPEDVKCYWEMLVETQRRSGRTVEYRSLDEFEAKFWGAPHRAGVLRGVVVRTREGKAVAGLLFRCYNRWIQELGVAYTDYSIQHKLYGQDLIKWHIMCWGQGQGCRIYDLMGVEVDSADPKRRAIFQFKEKWGGALVESPAFFNVYSPWRDKALHLGLGLIRKLRAQSGA